MSNQRIKLKFSHMKIYAIISVFTKYEDVSSMCIPFPFQKYNQKMTKKVQYDGICEIWLISVLLRHKLSEMFVFSFVKIQTLLTVRWFMV